ncbi:Argonaute family protein [Rhynchospora pubera]|uniref:Argonaute family protein n=1 Tax=Rhynchospora pubera TaxID=906938 RepID=A0AAV8C153_9POAL|nr:Argonaute family protein [Rhynchospora pubera]
MTWTAVGKAGRNINILSNHFPVRFTRFDTVFYQYTVSMKHENENVVENKRMSRKVIEKMFQTYRSELANKDYIYDGERSLFTVGPLSQSMLEFAVVLEEISARAAGSHSEGHKKRMKRVHKTTLFKVTLTYASKIPLGSIAVALRRGEPPEAQGALMVMVLNLILRQQQARMGCLLVRQSFFNGDSKSFTDLGGGVTAGRGVHSSFLATVGGGLSLNMDVATTMILTPGPVIDFLIANQNVEEPKQVNWIKAKRMLRNLRFITKHNKMEHKLLALVSFPAINKGFCGM